MNTITGTVYREVGQQFGLQHLFGITGLVILVNTAADDASIILGTIEIFTVLICDTSISVCSFHNRRCRLPLHNSRECDFYSCERFLVKSRDNIEFTGTGYVTACLHSGYAAYKCGRYAVLVSLAKQTLVRCG